MSIHLAVFRVGFTVPDAWNYGDLEHLDSFADSDVIDDMAKDQITKMQQVRAIGDATHGTKDEFVLFSWTLTWKASPAINVMAGEAVNPLASWAFNAFTPYSYPNVLLVDYIGAGWVVPNGGTEAEKEALLTWDVAYIAMAINIRLASDNCWIPYNSGLKWTPPPSPS
jgi:hypothetical protein